MAYSGAGAKSWKMLGRECQAGVPHVPKDFPGMVGRRGLEVLLSCSSKGVVLIVLFFLVSYEESNPKDAAAVTEGSKEGTEASASKGLEKKEK